MTGIDTSAYDVTWANAGSETVFTSNNDYVREWLEDNVQFGARWNGDALSVEPKYAPAIARSLSFVGFSLIAG